MGHRVGFIGLGTMGRPMAGHILAAQLATGGTLAITSRTPERHADLLDRGAVWAATPRELAPLSDVVVSRRSATYGPCSTASKACWPGWITT